MPSLEPNDTFEGLTTVPLEDAEDDLPNVFFPVISSTSELATASSTCKVRGHMN